MKIKIIENEKEMELEVTIEEIKDVHYFIHTHKNGASLFEKTRTSMSKLPGKS